MTMGFDDLIVGGQLRVGTGYCAPIKEGDYKINGSAHMEGPVVVGLGSKIKLGARGGDPDDPEDNTGTAPANLMITRNYNKDRDCFSAAIKRTLLTEGNVQINGDDGTPWAVNLKGNQEIIGNEQTDHALYVEGGGTVDSVYIDGDLFVTGAVDCGNKGRLAARFAAADASPKPFDMQHPTKGEGNRLRYACIEGPEVGVYFRGRLRRGKEIFLPNYWKGLVHIQSITVQLQPIGAHQDIIIKRWDDQKIYLQSNGGLPIDCFYHVYAERKDCNPLVVEYQGDGWEDYPDKDYKDPNFSGPPNIVTV
tara:strand:- start:71 stop:991 length:921 start_codon:yes stop_codon:yes gene_type:complete